MAIRNEAAVISEGLPSMGLKPLGLNEAITNETENAKQTLLEFQNAAASIIQGGINDTFFNMANDIGAAFASGDNAIKAGGAAILSGIGGVLQQFGKLVLATGVASEAFKKAITNPFGGGIGAIAAGAALIAIGGAVKGFAARQAQRGGETTPQASSVANVPTASTPTSRTNFGNSGSSSSGLQNVVFEIQGTKLVGVLSNTLARNRQLAGTLTIG